MAFATTTEVKASIAGALHVDVSAMPSFWTQVIADSTTAASDDIYGHFIELGYTAPQVLAWDRALTFSKFLARYQGLIDGAGEKDDVGEWRTELDYWRAKLEAITTLEVDDELADPATGGNVGHGSMSTATDLFGLDPDDSRRDVPTEW